VPRIFGLSKSLKSSGTGAIVDLGIAAYSGKRCLAKRVLGHNHQTARRWKSVYQAIGV
jgi:hypothetical protein